MSFGSDIAKLLASLDLDTRPFQRGARSVDSSLNKMEGGMGRVSTRAIAFGSAIGVGIERLAEKGIDVLFDSLRSGEEGLRVLQDATAQTNAVIESTGGAAGQTAASVRALAEELENLTTADDKTIQQGENLLLTFTNIGREVFPDATKAMVNMAIAMNKGNAETADFDSAALQLGKALQDPIKGITALRRVGVNFTADQEKRIKGLIDEGKLQEAQGVILAELAKEFGEAGEAAGKSEAAGLRRFHDAIEDIQISLASGLSPALDDIRAEITTALSDPQTQQAVRDLGIWLGEAAKSGLAFAKSIPWGQVADGLKTAAGFAGKLIGAFTNLPPGVQATIIGLVGLNKLAGGGVIKIGVDLFKEGAKGILGQFIQRGSPANPMFTKELGGLPGGGGGGAIPVAGAAKTGLSTLSKVFLVGEAIGLAVLVKEVADNVTSAAHDQAVEIGKTLDESLSKPNTLPDLNTKLAGINAGIDQINAMGNIPAALFHDTLVELERQQGEVVAAIEAQTAADKTAREDTPVDEIVKAIKADRTEPKRVDRTADLLRDVVKAINKSAKDQPDDITKKEQKHFDRLRDRIESTNIRTNTRLEQNRSATDRVRDRVESARIAVQTGTSRVATTTANGTDRIVAAISALHLAVAISNFVSVSGGGSVTQRTYTNRIEQKQKNSGHDFTS